MAGLVYCLLLLACLEQLVIAKDFWAIDCGGNATFPSTAAYPRNVTWEPDDGYVRGGVARESSSGADLSRMLGTMRVFESRNPAKSCYTIPVGSGRKVIARVWFYYGNYDGMDDPPQFELQFDSNHWTAVETESDDFDIEEAVYVTRSANTSICVARGETDQDPLISGIQVAVLGATMYGWLNSSRALFWKSRIAFGASDDIRDKYGRFWSNTTVSLNLSDYMTLTNTAPAITMAEDNEPPVEVFRTAITPKTPGGNITLRTPYLDSAPQPIYFSLYFTDPTRPRPGGGGGGGRSFHIYLDGSVIFNASEPIVPSYGNGDEYSSAIRTGSESTFLDLMSTPNVALPPVISAWELYLISAELNNGTDSRDVDALSTLKNRFEVLQQWTGDPCLPEGYNWEWVACDSNSPPRITKLLLSGYGLTGTLPIISSLDALTTIDLSNNSLTGDIPSSLGQMPNLRVLNLANNDFTSIPPALRSNNMLALNVSGNPQLQCTDHLCSPAASPQPKADGPSTTLPQTQPGGAPRLPTNKSILGVLAVCVVHLMWAVGTTGVI